MSKVKMKMSKGKSGEKKGSPIFTFAIFTLTFTF